MDNIIVKPFIKLLQKLSIESTSLILFGFCIISILILFKLFNKNGLYLYSIIAILVANIQVLKLVKFNFYPTPVALGNIVFASIYLCSGILTEHYDQSSAKMNIWYCFTAQILMTMLMVITIGHKPLTSFSTFSNSTYQIIKVEKAIELIFTPLPRLLIASLISFVISQRFGIWIFNLMKNINQNKHLGLRTMILVVLSISLDTILFNVLAWKILTPNPISLKAIFYTYVMPTWITQSLVNFLATPIIKWSYKFKA